ncbi:MAG: hypothetical protein KDI90_02230 [Alphaproteobacteria bacterium]|nr:hypothetical protein [Alphaproteobacteria bacterium]MCB9974804.1 hypothetical protein [Rhodospirillales bacterium]
MAQNLQPAGPSGAFNKTYVDILSGQYPELVGRLREHRVSREDSTLLNRLVSESTQMRVAVALHLAKYAPEGSKPREFADSNLEAFIEQCFVKKHPHREVLMDGILAFLVDNRKVFQHYTDLIRSWETTETSLARIMSKGGTDGRRGDSSSGSGSSSGSNSGKSGPEGEIPGFDPG